MKAMLLKVLTLLKYIFGVLGSLENVALSFGFQKATQLLWQSPHVRISLKILILVL